MKSASRFRTFLGLLSFAAGFLSCAVAASRLLPRPIVPEFDRKVQRYLARADQTDTVFMGSSRIYRQIVPSQFDEATRAAGQATNSYNLGVDGMMAPESYYAVDDFLRRRPHLRWFFIELQPIQPRFPRHYDGTIRAWWWHDWESTLLTVSASLRDPQMAERGTLDMLATHASLLLQHYVRPGSIAQVFGDAPWIMRPKKKRGLFQLPPPKEEIGYAGFEPMPGPPLSGPTAAEFEGLIAAYRSSTPLKLSPDLRDRLRQLAAAVRATGATPVFLATPSVNLRERIGDLRSQGIDADLLAFNDPVEYPSLYTPAMWANRAHLDEAGAHELTRLLAEKFAALPQRHPER